MDPNRSQHGAIPKANWRGRGNRQVDDSSDPQVYPGRGGGGWRGRGGGHERGRGRGDRGGRGRGGGNWRAGGNPNLNDTAPEGQGRVQKRPYQKRNYNLSYTKLLNLTQMENNDVVLTLSNSEYNFDTLIQDFLREDLFVLIVKVLAKVCLSDYKENKIKVLTAALSSHKFTDQFPIQICNSAERPVEEATDFMHNVVIFFENAVNHLAFMCSNILPSMTTCYYSMMGANGARNLGLDANGCLNSFQELINGVKALTEEDKAPQKPRSEIWRERQNKLHDLPPPNDFREITIFPTPAEVLTEERPFLRPNLVDRSYASVDHYLDVQFRLMKEDYVRPLREGIAAINSNNPKKIKEANVRQYENINFVRDNSRLIPAELLKRKKMRDVEGVLVHLNFNKNKKLKNTDWVHSRRFMFGSLLCFSNDKFKSLHLATVVDRDMAYLEAGFFRIQFCDPPSVNIYAETFTMIESEVFFDPYNHVLRTLQKLEETDFPFAEYIVKYQTEVYAPSYLEVEPAVVYQFPKFRYPVTMLDLKTWPSCEDMDLDGSQYKALCMALTRELAVIQGPPGTGKTFIGLKIANILVENRKASNRTTPILVVCLTNHALDQFLVGISKFTSKIVRIGGQSKCEEMAQFNLRMLRRHSKLHTSRFGDAKREIETNQRQKIDIDQTLKELSRGIVSYDSLKAMNAAPPNLFINGSQLLAWLFGQAAIAESVTAIGKLKFSITQNDLETKMQDLDYSIKTTTNFLEKQTLSQEVKQIQKLMVLLKDQLENTPPANKSESINYCKKLHALQLNERWKLYKSWINTVESKLQENLVSLDKDITILEKQLEELQSVSDLEILREADVVGMTTSGAARLHGLMRGLGAEIVIVEEAAEVMETHVVACLSSSCRHLILIGDHKQLRPSVAVYQLAKDYCFDISLFERMVNRAPEQCVTLEIQHRMAPEIASLITPAIYKTLKNDSSVKNYAKISGCPKRLFFVEHTHPEEMTDLDSHSRVNTFEAEFLLCLCRHLLMQGYSSSEITILTTYRGQMFYMRKEKSKYPDLESVLVTVVDNYQGEENKIILLSLVRSNADKKIGFLKLENRVNVALSRAKHGLYIVGNMECLTGPENGQIWKSVRQTLAKQDALGSALPLQCLNHPEEHCLISQGTDFAKKSPQGGCTLTCGVPLECGHRCQSICHTQRRDHKDMKCLATCGKPCSSTRHNCQKKCYEACGDCSIPVTKLLRCDHTATFPCHAEGAGFACDVDVEKTFPRCGHKAVVKCYVDTSVQRCLSKCDRRLDCGHKCEVQCHIDADPDHLNTVCSKICNKVNVNCSTGEHRCGRKCSEDCQPCPVPVVKQRICGHDVRVACSADADTGICNLMCTLTLPCGHKCPKACNQSCNPCLVEIEAKHPMCGHNVTKLCGTPFGHVICTSKCLKMLDCGHPCQDNCGVYCNTARCNKPVAKAIAACGHYVDLLCWEFRAGRQVPSDSKRCSRPCGAQLACTHVCPGTCGTCFQGKFHQLCDQPCGRSLICNHTCKEKCATMCPPCPEKCSVRCEHSKCPKICGEPCTPCKERCSNGCHHQRCTRTCGEKCDIDPCKEPCTKKIKKCKHDCVGMCGDPCPPLCMECDKEELTEIFLGNEDTPGARFLYLPECKHCIEIQGMDEYMKIVDDGGKGLAIKTKDCPKCKTAITVKRYGNLLKDNVAIVNKVKLKYFGTTEDNETQRGHLISRVEELIASHLTDGDAYPELSYCLADLVEAMQPVIAGRKNVMHAFDLRARQIEVDILSEICKTWGKCKTSFERDSLKESIDFLLQVFESKKRRISQQQVDDFTPELLRLQYKQIFLSFQDKTRLYPNLSKHIKQGLDLVNSEKLFDNEAQKRIKVVINEIKEICKNLPGLGINEAERIQIVQAIGLAAGHWYSCPNGHVYAIGECGGAMQQSKCPECGCVIGGGRHQLASGNQHFGGMDHSQYAAWSEQANMENYDL